MSEKIRHAAYIEHDLEPLRRGGLCSRTALCVCGWRGPQRATLELAADDALMHERSALPVRADDARRAELVSRIASNKEWLSKNWHLGKDPRRSCYANIEADERELAKLDAADKKEA